jgi:hypothetical protein
LNVQIFTAKGAEAAKPFIEIKTGDPFAFAQDDIPLLFYDPGSFLNNAMKGLSFFPERIYPFFDLRIFDQRRCMMRLDPCIDDE